MHPRELMKGGFDADRSDYQLDVVHRPPQTITLQLKEFEQLQNYLAK